MKLVAFQLLSLLLVAQSCSAFVLRPALSSAITRPITARMAVVELEPEPEGGEELSSATTVPGCRMKQMEQVKGVKSDDGTVYQFWMTAEVDGTLIKEYRTTILKDAARKANFPGFRKGQVPPYAQPQITQFAIQEAITKTVEAAVDAYGLKSLSGSDGEFNVKEEVTEMSNGYKIGDSLQFTATLNAAYDPEKQQAASSKDDDAADLEASPEGAVTTAEEAS